MNIDTLEPIIVGYLKESGLDLSDFLCGAGEGITHYGSRGDFSFSMKLTAVKDANGWRVLLKEPNTDKGKKSLCGLVRCRELPNGELEVFNAMDCEGDAEQVFREEGPGWRLWLENGRRSWTQSFEDVRERARQL